MKLKTTRDAFHHYVSAIWDERDLFDEKEQFINKFKYHLFEKLADGIVDELMKDKERFMALITDELILKLITEKIKERIEFK